MANTMAAQKARKETGRPLQIDRVNRLHAFAREYLKRPDFNGTAAAIAIGLSPKNAPHFAWEALKTDIVKDAIAKHRAEQEEIVKLTAVEVLKELWLRALTTMHDIATPEALEAAGVKPDIAPHHAACIKSIASQDAGRSSGASKRVEMIDNSKWLELIGKHLSMFTDKVQVEGKLSWADALKSMPEQTAEELEWVIAEKQRELSQRRSQQQAEINDEY